ncbi:DUF1571 domain-containing protein [Serratia aquatilis]|uniref:DUF1571 domain-containing protein n=1 Tax=Serratia aquatilis TaxID=1737515 RepID=A0ABV6E7W7_9GAMM
MSSFVAHAANEAATVFLPPLDANAVDPIILAQQQVNQLSSYQLRLHSQSPKGGNTLLTYSYRKPGYVRMDFSDPHHGAVLIYAPDSDRARVWPFGLGTLPVVSLSPDNALIQDPNGHRVDQSDIGTFLQTLRGLQQNGKTTVVGKEILSGQPVLHVSVIGSAGIMVSQVHRFDVWLESRHAFPVKIISYGANGQLIETVVMDAIVYNMQFPADFFTP